MKHKTKFRLPFSENWYTFWGGDTKELNKHSGIGAQNYAFDFIVVDENGRTYSGDGDENSDYFSFGKDILSPADGVVVEAVDGLRDNEPGLTNDYMFLGNHVLIKHVNKELSLLAHLRQGSVLVKAGDKVKNDQKLGECGNSGNTSQPHLHYQLQDSDIFARYNDDFKKEEVARGVKVYFSDIEVETKDGKISKKLHSPIRGELVKNANR